jgi:biopolymer transport protein TolR
MAFSAAGSGPSRPEMNVTPLIDILLVLIIVFMVAVSMSQEKGLEAQIPDQSTNDKNNIPPPDRTIVIQVVWRAKDQDPVLKINQDEVSWKDLELRLQRIFSSRVERIAFVRGDADVDFRYVADVIDIARQAGVQRMGLLTKE